MSIFIGPMRLHIDGKKELTSVKEVSKMVVPKTILIPLINGSTVAEVLVEEGDRVKVGTKVAVCNGFFEVPIYSSVSGIVKSVKKVMHSSLKMVDHLEILNDGLDETELLPFIDYKNATGEELVKFVKDAGIVGCGGAGFPTYVKYLKPESIDTIVINAIECEPFITADYKEIFNAIDDFADGLRILMKMSSAKKVVIGVKKGKRKFYDMIDGAIKHDGDITVTEVPDVYPMGWEKTLVYELLHKRYKKLPLEIGCVVNNATTVIAIAQAVKHRAPIIEKIVTVSGDAIKNPQNVVTRVGTPVSELIEFCGGYTSEEVKLVAGGPMMGKTITNDQFVISTSLNAVTILKNEITEPMTCLRCGKCSAHCPAALQPVRICEAEKEKNLESLKRHATSECIECGICTYVCPSKIEVTEGVRRAKRYLALKEK
ncbi:MAG: RnfABCDGE type electron transport complex subunit C [Anaerorhabdus sp.]